MNLLLKCFRRLRLEFLSFLAAARARLTDEARSSRAGRSRRGSGRSVLANFFSSTSLRRARPGFRDFRRAVFETVEPRVMLTNNAPVLTHTVLVGAADRDTAQPNPGVLVSSLTGGITDADPGAVKGIAIVGADQTHGTIQFSSNNGSSLDRCQPTRRIPMPCCCRPIASPACGSCRPTPTWERSATRSPFALGIRPAARLTTTRPLLLTAAQVRSVRPPIPWR